MHEYREIAASPELSTSVECFWTGRQDRAAGHTRVMPDGCADILSSAREFGEPDHRFQAL